MKMFFIVIFNWSKL